MKNTSLSYVLISDAKHCILFADCHVCDQTNTACNRMSCKGTSSLKAFYLLTWLGRGKVGQFKACLGAFQ